MQSKLTPRAESVLSATLLLGLGSLGICTAATQYVAERLHYHPALGHPWMILPGKQLPWMGRWYPPLAWFDWQARLYPTAKPTFNTVYLWFLLSMGLLLLLYALFIGSTRRSKGHPGIHGTAHWADEREVRNSGLLPEKGQQGTGVYVGGWLDNNGTLRYLRHDGPEHVAAIAPTRSGKGVGLVIPTLLSWPQSVVVNDMKGELWTLTAGWRQQDAGNTVLKFDPASETGSCAFNPLAEVRLNTPHEVGDVQNLVTIMVDPDGKGLADHWAKTAHAFLTGVILHLLYQAKSTHQTAGLSEVALALSDPQRPIDDLYKDMLENKHLHKGAIHPVVAAAARDMLNRPEQERGSVLSTAMSYLSIYRDPLVAKNTAHSDFSIRDLMHHAKPVSLYLVVRPADKDRLKPLMRLMINQIVRVLTREDAPIGDSHRHRLLLMLDEFPSYGRLEIFQEALAYIAGYGMKAYLIMQDTTQLAAAYGRDESILSNCHIRIAYAPNKIETAEWLSKMTGQTTVVLEEISTSGHRFGAVLQNATRSYQEIGRPLLTADECMRLQAPIKDKDGNILEPGEMLIFTSGNPPIKGTQILYFQDPVFSRRTQIQAPQTDRIQTSSTTMEAFRL